MQVLMIAFDRKLFEEGSDVRERILKQGELVDSLHVVVYARRALGYSKEQIRSNVWLYPTNSISRWLYFFDAYRIGKKCEPIDLVTAQDPTEVGLAGLFLARFHKARLQIQVHTDLFNPAFRKLTPLNRLRLPLARLILERADCIRVVSKRIADSLRKRIPKLSARLSVLPVLINVQTLERVKDSNVRNRYPQFDKLILIVSRFEKEKRVSLAIDTLQEVIKTHPKAGMVILGEGREGEHLKELVVACGLESSVVFEGWKPHIADYYRAADVLLQTSEYEGYGAALVEARILGTPVVATDVGVAREAGAVITPPRAHVIAEHIRNIFEGQMPPLAPYKYPYTDSSTYWSAYGALWEKCTTSKG